MNVQATSPETGDRRLAIDLHSQGIGVLSVDIFDTLLWRKVPEHTDVFLLLGQEWAVQGKLAPHVSAVGFAELRRTAERKAREKVQAVTGYREITLVDVYAGLPDSLFAAGFDKAARIKAELAREQSLLVLDRDLARLISATRAAGLKVILVSDTYFTSTELRGFLKATGFDNGLIDRLYVSCEAGKPKYRDLFDDVLKDMAVAPAAMLHIGDSLEADVNPCRMRGIGHLHYDKWILSPRLREIEFPKDLPSRARLLADHGDFGLTGIRARLHHSAPVGVSDEHRPYWTYGASTLSPVFAGFARWIAGECAREKSTKVFGLMREGRFLAKVVAAAAPDAPKLEELWLSRRAVIGAALYPDDLALLPEFVMVAPGVSTDEILAKIGLSQRDFQKPIDLPRDGLGPLCQAIVTVPALRDKVLAVSAGLRRNLLKGLAAHIDLARDETITLVDLGYAATIQTVLAGILAREGAKIKLRGLYLALNEKALDRVVADGADVRAFLSGDGFASPVGVLLSRTPDVLEHACMCREGSLARYDDTGAPVLLPNQRDETQLAQMEAVQAGILAGIAALSPLLAGTPHDASTLKAQVSRIIECAMLYPTSEEASTLGGWRHEANFDLNDRRRLTDLAFDPANLEYGGFPALLALGRDQVYWPAAALTQANDYLGAAFGAGALGTYTPQHLNSGPLLGGITIQPDFGIGFDPRRGGALALGLNPFGRGEIRAAIKAFGADACTRIKLIWPPAAGLIQIDYVSFVGVGEDEQRVQAITASHWTGTTTVGGAHLTSAGSPVELVLLLAPPPAFPHSLEMTLRFKYLRLDPMFGRAAS